MTTVSSRQIVAMFEAKLRQFLAQDGSMAVSSGHVAWLMENCRGDYQHAALAIENVQNDPPVESPPE